MSDVFADYGGLFTVGAIAASLIFIKVVLLAKKPATEAPAPVTTTTKKNKKKTSKKKGKAKNVETVEPELTETQKAKAEKEKAKAKARKLRRKAEKESESNNNNNNNNNEVKEVPKKKKKKGKKKNKKQQVKDTQVDASESDNDDDGWTAVPISSRTKKEKKTDGDDDSPKDPSKNSEDFEIPSKYYGRILGKGGAHLQALQEFFNVEIDVPNKKDGHNIVTIEGNAVDIQATKNQIDQLIEKGYSKVTHPETVDSHIIVPSSERRLIFGKGGANIKAIQEATGTQINMPDRSSSSEKVVIIGKKDGVKKCKLLIRELITSGFCEATHPGLTKKEIPFPFAKTALLVGPGGQTIKSIQGNTNTKINTPKQLGMPLVIIGKPEDIFSAEREIQNVLNPPVITLQDLATQTDNPWATVEEYGSWRYSAIEIQA